MKHVTMPLIGLMSILSNRIRTKGLVNEKYRLHLWTIGTLSLRESM